MQKEYLLHSLGEGDKGKDKNLETLKHAKKSGYLLHFFFLKFPDRLTVGALKGHPKYTSPHDLGNDDRLTCHLHNSRDRLIIVFHQLKLF